MRRLYKKILGIVCLVFAAGCDNPNTTIELPEGYQPTVLVTGANRGMGIEFVRQYADKGWRVIATARDPNGATELRNLATHHLSIIVEQLDVTDEQQILSLRDKYENERIDVLINNAGIKGAKVRDSELYELDDFEAVMHVNAFAPLRVSQAFLRPVSSSYHKKIIVISTHLGSISSVPNWGSKSQGESPYYSISKAAVNMALRIFHERAKDHGIRVGLLAPGAVKTEMLLSSGRDTSGAASAEIAVREMIQLIDVLGDESDLVDRSGNVLKW